MTVGQLLAQDAVEFRPQYPFTPEFSEFPRAGRSSVR